MAARKDTAVFIACQAPSGRITRAQAATNRGRFGVAPTLQAKNERKQSSKRGALDENACASAAASAPQPKRRKVLQDVTNISCANSYKKSTAATKPQPRPSRKVGGIPSKSKQCAKKVPKPPFPAVSRTSFVFCSNSVEETQKVEVPGPKEQLNVLPEIRESPRPNEELNVMPEIRESPRQKEDLIVLPENRESAKPKEQLTALLENRESSSLENIELNRDSSFHESSFQAGNIVNKSETADSKTGDSAALDFVDIDKDNGNPQMCVSYAADIYRNLMASELMRRPRSNYVESLQRDISKGMRGILIDWLVEVSEEYKLVPDTLYLTVYLIDQFLSRSYIERQKLQLLGITSMLIASKYEEICAPRVEEFCFITDNTYTKDEVLKMECEVLNVLGFHLSVPTTKTFLRRFLRAAQASHKAPSVTLGYLANYLAELTLTDYSFLRFLPSVVAASAVFLARWTIGQSTLPWNRTLEHYTSYKSSDIQVCVCALRELQHNSSACTLNAIREKYKQQRFECVANLTSPELAQSLFSRQASGANPPLLINNH